jgi:PAS domain S-box-containing protein
MTRTMSPLITEGNSFPRLREARGTEEAASQLRAAFDHAFQFIGLLDTDGTVLDINQTALDFIGRARKQVVGRLFWQTPWWECSGRERERLRYSIPEAADGNFVQYEISVPVGNRQIMVHDFSITPVRDQSGRVTLLIPAGHDVTERIRDEERIRTLNQELREHVSELAAANAQIARWNRELKQAVAARTREVRRATSQLTTRVLRAQEEERKRISRELHDQTAQSLATLLMYLDLLTSQVSGSGQRLTEDLARAQVLARRTLEETRALAHALRPVDLDDLGLVSALEQLAREFKEDSGVAVKTDLSVDHMPEISSDVEIALFRITQEALTNIRKYAHPASVRLALTLSGQTLQVEIEDDGEGFDLSDVPGPSRRGGLGLYGMRERARIVGGRLTVESTPGRGTKITARMPVR